MENNNFDNEDSPLSDVELGMELGMILFSNSVSYNYEAGWASTGLIMLAEIIAEHRKDVGLLVSNSGAEEFTNNVFSMRSYCWCDGGRVGHEKVCPPNFEHHLSGVKLSWYKHVERGLTSNMQKLSPVEWFDIIAHCRNSLSHV